MSARATVAEMAEHFHSLAAEHGVTVGPHSSGRAYRRRRHVGIPPIKSAVTYAVALHELGHIVGPGRSAPRLEQEAAAWEWAIRNALQGPARTRVFRAAVRRSLASYAEWAERRGGGRGCPKVPPPGHVFWGLLAVGTVKRRGSR